MIDTRWEQLADIIVNYSTKVRSGDKVLITMMELETWPLARAVYATTIKNGALPQIEFQSAYLERDLMIYGDTKQINWVPEMQAYGLKWADAYIGLRGARNTSEFDDIPPERVITHKRAMGEVSSLRDKNTRWVLVRVPNESFAQRAKMPLDEMMSFFFEAVLQDWEKEADRYQQLQQVFQAANHVRIVGKGTDLSFSTTGRKYSIAAGYRNMPDGEIATAPVDDSAEGIITFEFPAIYAGRIVEGICLEFSRGEVVRATAEKNQDFLHQLINMDEGSSKIGEFGLGMNYKIDRFCYDLFYDEKIGGTTHIALGRAYAHCGGINQSALHWDIVKDLREEGEIYLDRRKVFKNGQYLIP